MPTTTADTPSPQGTSLEEAAKLIEGILEPTDVSETSDTSTDAADAAPDTGSVAAEADAKETPAPEEEQDGEAEATDETEDTEATEQRPATITVKIDGKEEAISLEEAARGYQRQSDYSRRMAELKTEREKFSSEAKAVTEERETYKTMLVALRDQLQSLQPEEPNWDEVYKADPVGYARRRDEWRDKQDKIAAAKFELERIQSEERKEAEANLRQQVAASREKMLELQPAWKDPKVWEADRQHIVNFAREHGYSTEEIAATLDPRAVVIFDMARRWKDAQANKPKPVPAKGPKVAPAGGASPANSQSKLNAAQQRLAKSGRIEDAAKVFEQLI